MSWHWVDYIIIGVITLSVITGLFRGFIKELVALCIWILAIWLSFKYSSVLEEWLQSYIQDKTVRTAVAFIAVLLGTIIVGGIFNAQYSMFEKYILNAGYRMEANSSMDANSRWGAFPTIGAAWQLGDEDFILPLPSIPPDLAPTT